jgi:hypothetical protein
MRYILLFDIYSLFFFVCVWGAPLMRGWVYLLYMLLAFASTVFFGSESFGTLYSLSFEISLSIVSYGSQGHGTCIPPFPHTDMQRELFSVYSLHTDPHRKLSSIFGVRRGAAYKLLEQICYSAIKSRHFLYCRIDG